MAWDPAESLPGRVPRVEKVREYSLGMRQKLAIVQALMEHQELVLLDEPTNGLDKASVNAFLTEIDHQSQRGATVIIASHHDDEIHQVADSIYTIENGHVEAPHDPTPDRQAE